MNNKKRKRDSCDTFLGNSGQSPIRPCSVQLCGSVTETWKEVAKAPDYEVSNHGRVRRLSKEDTKCLSLRFRSSLSVGLYVDDKQVEFLVRNLVAEAFCAKMITSEGAVVEHVNGDKTNVHAMNLRWSSPSNRNVEAACEQYKCDWIREIWRTIDEFAEYEVSDHGRVRNKQTRYMLSGTKDKYTMVQLYKDDDNVSEHSGRRRKSFGHLVHRLVAAAFCPKREEQTQVNHRNGNTKDNHATNLEWCTPKANTEHSVTSGLAKCKTHAVLQIDATTNQVIAQFPSIKAAAKALQIRGHGNITTACLGKRKTCHGYAWRYSAVPEEFKNPDEKWQPHPHLKNLLVSDQGRFRNKIRKEGSRGSQSVKGYLYTKIGQRKMYVHRLVAETFLPSPGPKQVCVNHKNGRRTDNRTINLEWVTSSENSVHALGRHISQYSLEGDLVTRFNSVKDASKSSGIGYSSIIQCVNGNTNSAGGFVWKDSTV